MRPARKIRKRPIVLARYTPQATDTDSTSTPEAAPIIEAITPVIRHSFPVAGEEREGGHSDGYCFRITFAAGTLQKSYALVRSFLREQGYAGVPLPATAAELRHFRLPRKMQHQLSLFGDNGYVHNPVKILFPIPVLTKGALVLEIYNEHNENHLLRFHRRI